MGPVAVCALLASLGCQSVAKLEDRVADPPPKDQCTLPTEGDAKIRIANFFPATSSVDFCIKPAGSASYGHPVLRNAGTDSSCADGLAFKQMTVPFAVKSGVLDVKVVPAGAGGCGQPALAESLNVAVPSGAVTQLLHLGGHLDASRVVSMREGLNASTLKIRFMNAISGIGPLNFGLADGARLPTTISVNLVQEAIAFGATVPPAAKVVSGGTADDLSYVGITSTSLTFGGSRVGDKNAVFVVNNSRASAGKFGLYAVGDPTDIRFPPRALMCDENAAVGATGGVMLGCAESELPSLSFEVYGTALYGSYAKYADERGALMPGEIAKSDTDILCLTDTWRREDKERFKDAGLKTGAFPYSAQFDTTPTTPVNDPRDLDGNPPAPPLVKASCGDDPALANALIDCLETKCNTKAPGDDTGGLTTSDCVSSQCLARVIPLATGTTIEKQACFGCVVFDAEAYQPFSYVKTDCFDPAGAKGYFAGQNPILILSKFPVSNVEGYVLPGLGQKRVVVSASVQYEAGKSLDVHCGEMISILDSPFNYNGPYSTSHDKQGYMDEQHLQAVRAIEWVKQRSAGKPALIGLGVFASEQDPNPDPATRNAKFVDLNPIVPRLLREAFPSAQAQGYIPLCTACGSENPLLDPSQYAWYSRIYINDQIDPAAVVSSERRYTDAIVPIKDSAPIPLSENFSYRVKVLRP